MITYSKKICLLGDFAVGKTSLVRRFVYNKFDNKYLSTIGVKVSRKTISIPRRSENDIVELVMLLWDLAGGTNFNQPRASYLRGVSGAILVCDLTREATLNRLPIYVEALHEISPHAHLIMAANKSDLTEEYEVDAEQIKTVAEQISTPYYRTSAKEGSEVDKLFRHLGRLLVSESTTELP